MIYLFYGSDTEKVRRQAFAFIEAARKKQPEVAYLRLTREELSALKLEEAAAANGLFVSRLLVLIDEPFPATRKSAEDDEDEAADSSSLVEEHIEALAKSDNAIVIVAPKLHAAKAKKLAAKVEKEYKYDLAPSFDRTRGFNANLVNALGAREGAKLWLEIIRARKAGDAPEQVHGLLHWKARDLLDKRPSAATRKLSLDLITLLMDSRRKGLDLSESLERFALSI